MEKERTIIAVCNDWMGLSNRIKCFVSSWIIADKLSLNLKFYWEKSDKCNCSFSQLFSNKVEKISKKELNKILSAQKAKIVEDFPKSSKKLDKYILFSSPSFVSKTNKKRLHTYYSDATLRDRKVILNHLKKLHIKENILKEAERFVKKHKINECIGLHVRRGDFKTVPWGDISQDKHFFNEIDSTGNLKKKQRYFLTTDSKKTERIFKSKLKKNVIFRNKKVYRNSEEGIKDALIDILILSKTSSIIGTYGSSFTELAWWFSGCRQKIKIVGIKEKVNEIEKSFFTKGKQKETNKNFSIILKKQIISSIYESKRNMKRFRHFLIQFILQDGLKKWRKEIPYYFISFIPLKIKNKIKKYLSRFN